MTHINSGQEHTMSLQTAIAIAFVVGFGAAQYILMIQALRDLIRRPRVRGGNKAAWGLVILCLPVVGPLLYSWMGPTSLLRRPDAGGARLDPSSCRATARPRVGTGSRDPTRPCFRHVHGDGESGRGAPGS